MMALPRVRHRGALRVIFLLFLLLSFVFVRHVRATVHTSMSGPETAKGEQLDSFPELLWDVGVTPGQARAGVFPDNQSRKRERGRRG